MTDLTITDVTSQNGDSVDNFIDSLTDNSGTPSEQRSEVPQDQAVTTTEPQITNTGPESNAVLTENVNGPSVESNPIESELDAAVEQLRSLIVPPHQLAPWLRVHLYGRPGSRKTVTAANSLLRTLIVNIEEGAVSLNNHPEIAANCEVMEYKNFQQMHVLAEVLQAGRFPEFKVIQFDTFSELAQEEVDTAYEGNKNNQRIARLHPELAAGTDYQVATEHMRRLCSKLKGLDRHVIFISHLKEEKDQKGNIVRIRPNISPALLKYMDAFVHVTGYMSSEFQGTQGVVATLQPHPDAIIDAKTRVGGLPRKITDPSFAQILEANERMRKQNV
jgi:hypothetical protein